MRITHSAGAALAAVALVAAVAPVAAGATAPSHGVTPRIDQSYTCHTPVGDESFTIGVTGKATIKGSRISLKKVLYTVTNDLGLSITVKKVKVHVPDPAKSLATYKKNSAKVSKKPAGWQAGHDSSGIFAYYPGSQTVPDGKTVSIAALSAKYKAKGAKGDEVDFQPGDLSFTLTSPIQGDVTCTADDPVGTFASVTL